MHIGIDCRLPYYEAGGISEYIRHLINGLAGLDKQNDYTVFHSRKDHKSYLPVGASNFTRKRLWTPCHHRIERWLLSLELLPFRLDIFHSPDFIPPRFETGRKIITIHDLNFLFFPEFLDKQSLRYYAGQIDDAVREADHILADSYHTRNDILQHLKVPERKVTTIHLAANPDYQRPIDAYETERIKQKYKLPSEFILFVGTISPRKNIKTVLQAMMLLNKEAKLKIPLVMVGRRGWRSGDIFADDDLESVWNQVLHLEHVTPKELISIYALASVLVLPSIYEGFGLPPLEAMHAGCPVITSDRSSLPEVVGEAGIMLDPLDVAGWAEALQAVLVNDTMRNAMISRGKRQAQNFSWEKTATQTLEIYQKVFENG